MATKRTLITKALQKQLKEISVSNGYNTDLYENVLDRFIFPDTNPDLPLLCLTSGRENISYIPGGLQERSLTIIVRGYVEAEDPTAKLEDLIVDVETCVKKNERITLSDGSRFRDIRAVAIETDEGVLAPLGIFEMELVVEY